MTEETKFEVRPELLTASPWTEEDGIIREFFFLNEEFHARDMEIWDFRNEPSNACLGLPPCCWVLMPICVPICYMWQPYTRKMYSENQIENLWARRLALTKDGIQYRMLRRKPVTFDQAHPCATWCCAIGRFPDQEIGATSKVIPYDRVQDVRTDLAAGGTRRIVQVGGCCPYECGEVIPDVGASCEVDTAGSGSELVLSGLVNPAEFRACVIALKHGRDLPSVGPGSREGTYNASAIHPAATHSMLGASVQGAAAPVAVVAGFGSGLFGGGSGRESWLAPTNQVMQPGAGDYREMVTVLRSVDQKLGQLLMLAEKHAKQHL
jgi:hypothetical protein